MGVRKGRGLPPGPKAELLAPSQEPRGTSKCFRLVRVQSRVALSAVPWATEHET